MATDEPIQLGRYRILGELGRGAMGVVYLAEDPALKRGVAIKVVASSSVARHEALARFQREAECGAKVHHPHIVSVFDVGEDPHFGPYMAMEYVEGESLADKIRKGPISHEDVASYALQGALALDHAHRAGILHRDIKAANFLIARDGTLKLMDFGIARSAESLLATGLLCTPAYASPQLLRGGQPSEVDDRWAFAVTLFHSLTGRVPFDATSLAGTLAAIADAPPDIREDFDPALAEVFHTAFAKDPDKRYPDLPSFVGALLAALDLDPVVRSTLMARFGFGTLEVAPLPHVPSRTKRLLIVVAALAGVGLGVGWMAAARRSRVVSITSSPSGAEVIAGNTRIGRTPLQEVRVPASAKRLEFKRDGYIPVVRSLAKGEKSVWVQLEPEPWSISLQSHPTGADVLVDGVKRGVTPLQDLELPGKGTHQIELQHPGYRPWSMTVSKTRKPPATIDLEPLPKPKKKARTWDQKIRDLFKKK